jgi:hypothetical protein
MQLLRKALPILACLLAGATARAQRATEVYIPIGRSPGVSGKITAIGTCIVVEARERLVTVRADGKTWTAKVTKVTKIYLDRSAVGLPNTYGTVADLSTDRLMEVKYCDGQRTSGGECEWIKVQIGAPAVKR